MAEEGEKSIKEKGEEEEGKGERVNVEREFVANEELKRKLEKKEKEIQYWRRKSDHSAQVSSLVGVELKVMKDQLKEAEKMLRQKTKQIDFVLSQLAKEKEKSQDLELQLSEQSTNSEANKKEIERLLDETDGLATKNDWFSRLLKKAREESSMATTQNEVLKDRLRVVTEELEENQAKYGLFGEGKVRKVLEKQQQYLQENGLLVQKIIKLEDKSKRAIEELQQEREKSKEQGQEIERLKKRVDEEEKGKISSVTKEREILEKYQEREGKISELMLSLGEREKEKEIVEMELKQARQREEGRKKIIENLEERKKELEKEVSEQMEENNLTLHKTELLRNDLSLLKEEMFAKDQQILRLRDELSKKFTMSSTTVKDDLKHFGKNKIEEQLEHALAASRAHQSHAQLLNAEIKRIEAEKEKAIIIKTATITRLQKNLVDLQNQFEELHASVIHFKERGGSPPPELKNPTVRFRTISKIALTSPSSSSSSSSSSLVIRDEETEELISEIEYLKKEYFCSLVITFKMQRLVDGETISVDSIDLYELAKKQDVKPRRWGEWINAQMTMKMKEAREEKREGED